MASAATVVVATGPEPELLEPGPVPELSTETSNTVRNEDGSYTAKIASGPINYQDESGDWVPISNDLVDAPGAAYAVENEANSYTVSIPENPAITPVRFETRRRLAEDEDGRQRRSRAGIEGSAATFEDVTPAADEVTITATDGREGNHHAGLCAADRGQLWYTLTVSPGVTPVLTPTEPVEFHDGSGSMQFVMPVPNMQDSATPEPAYTNAVTYCLAPQGTGWKLTVTPDLGWLSDPVRVYPVAIDPTCRQGDQKDCWIQSDMPNSNRCHSEVIRAGRVSGGTRRGLLDFGVSSVPAAATINSATLYLHLLAHESSGNGGATGFSLYQPKSTWTSPATWNNSGTLTGQSWNGGSSGAKLSNDVPVMGGQGDWGWKGWNVTNTVREWRSGVGIENRGFMVRQESETVSKGVGFVGATSYGYSVYRPILRVTYSDQWEPCINYPTLPECNMSSWYYEQYQNGVESSLDPGNLGTSVVNPVLDQNRMINVAQTRARAANAIAADPSYTVFTAAEIDTILDGIEQGLVQADIDPANAASRPTVGGACFVSGGKHYERRKRYYFIPYFKNFHVFSMSTCVADFPVECQMQATVVLAFPPMTFGFGEGNQAAGACFVDESWPKLSGPRPTVGSWAAQLVGSSGAVYFTTPKNFPVS